jgi:hypothetical protein
MGRTHYLLTLCSDHCTAPSCIESCRCKFIDCVTQLVGSLLLLIECICLNSLSPL